MKPLIVLITLFLIALGLTKILKNEYLFRLSARIAMSGMLLFTSLGHFMFPDGMAMMIPAFIPAKEALVYLTGIFEIAAAVGLLVTNLTSSTAKLLIVFFLLILPANIYAAVHEINFQSASFDGPGLKYLWFRIPFQFFLIGWVYYSGIYTVKK